MRRHTAVHYWPLSAVCKAASEKLAGIIWSHVIAPAPPNRLHEILRSLHRHLRKLTHCSSRELHFSPW